MLQVKWWFVQKKRTQENSAQDRTRGNTKNRGVHSVRPGGGDRERTEAGIGENGSSASRGGQSLRKNE